MDNKESVKTVALVLRSPKIKSVTLALEMLSAVCFIPGGHESIMDGQSANLWFSNFLSPLLSSSLFPFPFSLFPFPFSLFPFPFSLFYPNQINPKPNWTALEHLASLCRTRRRFAQVVGFLSWEGASYDRLTNLWVPLSLPFPFFFLLQRFSFLTF